MIVKYGQQMLCQTCADHPGFRNSWEDRVGLGIAICFSFRKENKHRALIKRNEVLADKSFQP